MVTKDNNNGLLSRMVKLIRRPAQEDPESEMSVMGRESEINKLALKERIERKRQDDAVRRREFNHLRKLRNDGPLTGRYVAGQRVEFQNSASFNPEDRALTVKKIDAIEAQLSKHWFELKQTDAAARAAKPGMPPAAPRPPGAGSMSIPKLTELAQTSSAAPGRTPSTSGPVAAVAAPVLGAESAEPLTDLVLPSDFEVPNVPPQVVAFMNSRHSVLDSGISGFSNSNLMSVEMGDGLADPGLQEAAIRFADGDEQGAEAVLLAILQADTAQSDSAAACAAALFDLYRATGQQASFDVVAMDFAQRFGRSPPEWFSTPDLLACKVAVTAQESVGANSGGRENAWECPVALDLPTVQSLRATVSSTKVPQHLHWNQIKTIQPDAVQELADLFEYWCLQPVKLYFAGEEALEKTLKLLTPAADKRVDPIWWRVRLDALRVLNLQDAFETVAMDFCMLYEVSPPSWVDARCECVHERVTASAASTEVAASEKEVESTEARVVELSGLVLGDAIEALDKLKEAESGLDTLVISCSQLIRVDFSAAGSILNWVAERQTEGCHVQFCDVPRLVAAFFTVMGIHDHARVAVRTK